ncbi:hypothetical protein BBJ28_00003660 [Nothophytophthora sp. Chile5]|nr:hypothetical protein BBJ28_00003660 [Nothophytophthora sp. Chile5]
MVQDRAETGEYFQVRRLLWDELKLNVRASEEQELRGAIGSFRIAENEDALTKRQHVPEPPGRQLLLEKLKLLAADMRRQPRHVTIQSAKDVEILEYVLSTADDSGQYSYRQAPMTPRMDDAASGGFPCDLADGVALRPGTANGKRPTTGGSQRPKDLIDDDRRKVAEVKPPPSLSELHEFRKTLEKTLEDQVRFS